MKLMKKNKPLPEIINDPEFGLVGRIWLNAEIFTIVSLCDYEFVSGIHWHAVQGRYTNYAQTTLGRGKSRQLHRFILNVTPGQFIDHVNGNGLDNRRENLRIATRSQNAANSKRFKTNKSGQKGVFFKNQSSRWIAQVRKDGKVYQKSSKSKKIAVELYKNLVSQLFGEFANVG